MFLGMTSHERRKHFFFLQEMQSFLHLCFDILKIPLKLDANVAIVSAAAPINLLANAGIED